MDRTTFQPGMQLDPSKPDENSTWQMTLETLTSELSETGIAQTYIRQFAAFLFSAVYNHFPLFLIGPSGHTIADALSVSLFAATAGTLDASIPYDAKYLHDADQSSDQIITVENIFSGNWLIPLTGHIQNTHKFFIFLHPFPEDLQIEPHSLFRCIHPIFTEIILDKVKEPDFLGGKNIENYTQFESKNGKPSGSVLTRIPATHLYTDRLLKVIADAYQMLGSEDEDSAFLLGAFPYTYAIGRNDIIQEKLSSHSSISKYTRQRIDEFLKA